MLLLDVWLKLTIWVSHFLKTCRSRAILLLLGFMKGVYLDFPNVEALIRAFSLRTLHVWNMHRCCGCSSVKIIVTRLILSGRERGYRLPNLLWFHMISCNFIDFLWYPRDFWFFLVGIPPRGRAWFELVDFKVGNLILNLHSKVCTLIVLLPMHVWWHWKFETSSNQGEVFFKIVLRFECQSNQIVTPTFNYSCRQIKTAYDPTFRSQLPF